jgi:hypothetical protein
VDLPELTREEFDRQIPAAWHALTLVKIRHPFSGSNPEDLLERGYDVYGQVNWLLAVYAGRKLLHVFYPLRDEWGEHVLSQLNLTGQKPIGWLTVADEEFTQLVDGTWLASTDAYSDHNAERLHWLARNELHDGKFGAYTLFLYNKGGAVLHVPEEGKISAREFKTADELLDHWLSVGGDDWTPEPFFGMKGGYTP